MSTKSEDFTPVTEQVPFPERNGSVTNEWLAEYLKSGFSNVYHWLKVNHDDIASLEHRTRALERIAVRDAAARQESAKSWRRAFQEAAAHALIVVPIAAILGVVAGIVGSHVP